MSIRKLMKLGVVAAVSAAMFGCGGGGGPSLPSKFTVPGKKAIDGYLKDATVYVVCNGVRYLAPELTNNTGDFKDFSIPYECRNEPIHVEGGKDTITNEEFRGVLLAKPGQNVTPLTTLVTLNPALEDKLENLTGGKIDVDYVSENVTGDVLDVAQTVVQVVSKAAEEAGITHPEEIKKVFQTVANSLANVTDITNDTQIVKAVVDATATKVAEIANGTTAQVVDINKFKEALEIVANATVNAIPDNQTVSLESISSNYTSALNSATVNATTHFSSAVAKLEAIPKTVEFAGKEGNVDNNTFTLYVPLSNVEESKELELTIAIANADKVIGENSSRTYEVSFIATITDKNSKRKAVVSLDSVNVTINGDGTIESIVVPGADKGSPAKLTISGTDSTGKAIDPVVVENKQTDTSFDGIIGLESNENRISFDLSIVESRVQGQVSEDHPLHMIDYRGDYELEIRIEGLPVDTIKGNLRIAENAPPRFEWGSLDNLKETYYTGDKIEVSGAYAEDPEGVGIESCKLWIYYPDGNKDWVDTHMENGTCEVVSYPIQLDTPGTYKFVFEATDEDGVSNSETKEFKVVGWPPVPEGYVKAHNTTTEGCFSSFENDTTDIVCITSNSTVEVWLPTDLSQDECIGGSSSNYSPVTYYSNNATKLLKVESVTILGYSGNTPGCLAGKPFYVITDGDKLFEVNATGSTSSDLTAKLVTSKNAK